MGNTCARMIPAHGGHNNDNNNGASSNQEVGGGGGNTVDCEARMRRKGELRRELRVLSGLEAWSRREMKWADASFPHKFEEARAKAHAVSVA